MSKAQANNAADAVTIAIVDSVEKQLIVKTTKTEILQCDHDMVTKRQNVVNTVAMLSSISFSFLCLLTNQDFIRLDKIDYIDRPTL
ncbi:hypothetical protein Lal_00036582 [Lupinus albus]|nr:hypothetical protein Lal_00036582 [Lupinus albus]